MQRAYCSLISKVNQQSQKPNSNKKIEGEEYPFLLWISLPVINQLVTNSKAAKKNYHNSYQVMYNKMLHLSPVQIKQAQYLIIKKSGKNRKKKREKGEIRWLLI